MAIEREIQKLDFDTATIEKLNNEMDRTETEISEIYGAMSTLEKYGEHGSILGDLSALVRMYMEYQEEINSVLQCLQG